MSFDALAWAGKQRPGSPARKLILFALADRHNTEENVAYPSIAWLSEWSNLDRKTVISSIKALEAAGLISDSGRRFGSTGQVKGYRLHLETVPKTEQYQKRNSTVFPAKESQKRNTEPVREPRLESKASNLTHSGKPNAEKSTAKANAYPKPEGVDPQAWRDFLENRKRKRLPNTASAHRRLMNDLARLSDEEWPPGRLIEHAAARGWAGIYDPRENSRNEYPSQPAGKSAAAYRGLVERDADGAF